MLLSLTSFSAVRRHDGDGARYLPLLARRLEPVEAGEHGDDHCGDDVVQGEPPLARSIR